MRDSASDPKYLLVSAGDMWRVERASDRAVAGTIPLRLVPEDEPAPYPYEWVYASGAMTFIDRLDRGIVGAEPDAIPLVWMPAPVPANTPDFGPHIDGPL